MKSTPLAACALLALACAATTSQASTQWKWRTPEGRCCIYSDRPPPPEIADKDILQRPRGGVSPMPTAPAPQSQDSASAVATKAADPELEARRRKEQETKDAARKAEEEKIAKQRAENCARAQEYKRSLDSGIRISRTAANGEREVLDDTARSKENDRVREAIEANCK